MVIVFSQSIWRRATPISTIAAVNLALEVLCILLSAIVIVCLRSSEDRDMRVNRLFVRMLVVNIGVLLSDAVTWLFDGVTGPGINIAIRVANACVYSFGYIILAVFADYLVSFIATKTRISRRIVHVMSGLCVIAILLVIVSQFNHMYYWFDENNVYHRGDWYWLSQVWPIVLMIINLGIMFRYRHSLSRREMLGLLTYELFPIIAMIIQIFVFGLTLLYIGTTVSMFIIYVSILVEQSKRLKEQEQELTESRIAIMLSQIQPHFLYNSLVVIKHLCIADQNEAREAIVDFSDYLRMNLDSLSQKTPIHFSKELEHVKTYLSLQKRRFGDTLQVEYDIQAESFLLPSLTVQPLVENAIRHGITMREDGGTVTISTREQETCWQITVHDNGIGFDASAPKEDGRSHIGIDNVRNRLHTMSGGDLSIQSELGVGTSASIFIPKEGLAS